MAQPIDWEAVRAVFESMPSASPRPPLPQPTEADQDATDAAEERAAILEFDAGLSRQEAERRAGLGTA